MMIASAVSLNVVMKSFFNRRSSSKVKWLLKIPPIQ